MPHFMVAHSSGPKIGSKKSIVDPKGQLNSEWIYEVILSFKIPTKNYLDICPTF